MNIALLAQSSFIKRSNKQDYLRFKKFTKKEQLNKERGVFILNILFAKKMEI